MKKILVGATAALAAVALSGGLTSAQEYPPGPSAGVAGSTTCVDAPGPPQLSYSITFSGVPLPDITYELSFTRAGAPYGSPISVASQSGAVTFPPGANFTAEGWTLEPTTDQLVPGGVLFASETGVRVIATVVNNGITYTSPPSLVIFDPVDCADGSLTPEPEPEPEPTPEPEEPTQPPVPDPDEGAALPPPGQPQPPATAAPPAQRPLPSAGLSTLESSLRIGALLLIGGLGVVIVARRRRYTTSPTPAA